MQCLEGSQPQSTADDPKYQAFLAGEPHEAGSHVDWASEFHQQPSSSRLQQAEARERAYEQAWQAAQGKTAYAASADHQKPHTGLGPFSAFQQSQQTVAANWAEDFARQGHPAAGPSQQVQMPHHQGHSWASEFQSLHLQPGTADPPWVIQFANDSNHPWAEQFAEQQQQDGKGNDQKTGSQLTPEERKAMKGPQADDPLEDKAALSWVRQFNEQAELPSANFGNGTVLPG